MKEKTPLEILREILDGESRPVERANLLGTDMPDVRAIIRALGHDPDDVRRQLNDLTADETPVSARRIISEAMALAYQFWKDRAVGRSVLVAPAFMLAALSGEPGTVGQWLRGLGIEQKRILGFLLEYR